MSESGYRFDCWLEWMAAHAAIRPDGRVTHLGGNLLPESHRNTLALWYEHGERIPLGRWDEILVAAGLQLTTDFEHWLEEYCSTDGFESAMLEVDEPLIPIT